MYIYIYIPRVAAAVKTATSVNQQGARDVSLRQPLDHTWSLLVPSWKKIEDLIICLVGYIDFVL